MSRQPPAPGHAPAAPPPSSQPQGHCKHARAVLLFRLPPQLYIVTGELLRKVISTLDPLQLYNFTTLDPLQL